MVEQYPRLTNKQMAVLDKYGILGIAPCKGMDFEEAIGHILVNHKSLTEIVKK